VKASSNRKTIAIVAVLVLAALFGGSLLSLVSTPQLQVGIVTVEPVPGSAGLNHAVDLSWVVDGKIPQVPVTVVVFMEGSDLPQSSSGTSPVDVTGPMPAGSGIDAIARPPLYPLGTEAVDLQSAINDYVANGRTGTANYLTPGNGAGGLSVIGLSPTPRIYVSWGDGTSNLYPGDCTNANSCDSYGPPGDGLGQGYAYTHYEGFYHTYVSPGVYNITATDNQGISVTGMVVTVQLPSSSCPSGQVLVGGVCVISSTTGVGGQTTTSIGETTNPGGSPKPDDYTGPFIIGVGILAVAAYVLARDRKKQSPKA
jgi:hypothetical protein